MKKKIMNLLILKTFVFVELIMFLMFVVGLILQNKDFIVQFGLALSAQGGFIVMLKFLVLNICRNDNEIKTLKKESKKNALNEIINHFDEKK